MVISQHMSDICNAFLEEEQPVYYQNRLFWQKLYAIHPLQAASCFSGFEVQLVPAESSNSLSSTYFQNVL